MVWKSSFKITSQRIIELKITTAKMSRDCRYPAMVSAINSWFQNCRYCKQICTSSRSFTRTLRLTLFNQIFEPESVDWGWKSTFFLFAAYTLKYGGIRHNISDLSNFRIQTPRSSVSCPLTSAFCPLCSAICPPSPACRLSVSQASDPASKSPSASYRASS